MGAQAPIPLRFAHVINSPDAKLFPDAKTVNPRPPPLRGRGRGGRGDGICKGRGGGRGTVPSLQRGGEGTLGEAGANSPRPCFPLVFVSLTLATMTLAASAQVPRLLASGAQDMLEVVATPGQPCPRFPNWAAGRPSILRCSPSPTVKQSGRRTSRQVWQQYQLGGDRYIDGIGPEAWPQPSSITHNS